MQFSIYDAPTYQRFLMARGYPRDWAAWLSLSFSSGDAFGEFEPVFTA